LNFHLFQLLPFEVKFATPADFGDGRFTFDPSGRDIPLFRPDQRPGPPNWHPPREWELPGAIPCRQLGEVRYLMTADLIEGLGVSQAAEGELLRYAGIVFPSEARLRRTIAALKESAEILPHFEALLAEGLTADSPKARLIPSPVQRDPSAVAVTVGPNS